ncbi:MAG: hypothetical protein RID09_04210 [Coleofasciculus sp. G1-WW12-02]|uniref:hypothetical protein n=1 Tax=Coleofasciculus sp. G1-WW12-02 TaxID=3068483 RepID=UPI00330341A5
MTQGNSEQGKLYTRFISNLKRIQYFGYFLVVAFSLIFLFGTGFFQVRTAGANILAVVFPLLVVVLQGIIGCLTVYVITQALIAIVDLLSRIELNTRSR